MEQPVKGKTILGLDVGANSIGWALIEEKTRIIDAGVRIFEAAVLEDRKSNKTLEQGGEVSRNKNRRDARSARRRLERLTRRLVKLAHILQNAGLLPEGDIETPQARDDFFKNLDAEIMKRCKASLGKKPPQLPYYLRAKALGGKLELDEIGRALCHICQRRGFKSNRKESPKSQEEEEKLNKIEKAAGELKKAMDAINARTLGEYFNKLGFNSKMRGVEGSPGNTLRKMYEDEFNAIWQSQGKFHSDILTDDLKMIIEDAIFFQRHFYKEEKVEKTIGPCQFEPECKRAPWAYPEAQRYRLIQKVNDTIIYKADGKVISDGKTITDWYMIRLRNPIKEKGESETKEQESYRQILRKKLIGRLEEVEELEFEDAKALLGLTKEDKFNWEKERRKKFYKDESKLNKQLEEIFGKDRWDSLNGDEKKAVIEDIHHTSDKEDLQNYALEKWGLNKKASGKFAKLGWTERKSRLQFGGEESQQLNKFPGNKTLYRCKKVFSKEWDNFNDEKKTRIINDLIKVENYDVLERIGKETYELDEDKATKFSKIKLQSGYCRLSLEAILKVLSSMESGECLYSAIKEAYGVQKDSTIEKFLPPVFKFQKYISNPAVIRALTELRKVVNAIIREYGRPNEIKIELARELRNSKSDRESIYWDQFENREAREYAKEMIPKITDGQISKEQVEDNPEYITKFLLWEECKHFCPYTLKPISPIALFITGDFQIEHIIPISRVPDDSYKNKTLCHISFNDKKRNNTPYELLIKGKISSEEYDKMIAWVKEFKGKARGAKLHKFMLKDLDEYIEKFTNRQLNDTKYASRLGRKYLGLLYGDWEKIKTSSGMITSQVRNALNLNSILSDGGYKSRDDHRHHAVDAVAIALANPSIIKQLSDYAATHPRVNEKAPKDPRFKITLPWDNFKADISRKIYDIKSSHRVSRKVSGKLHEETNISPKGDKKGVFQVDEGLKFYTVRKRLCSLEKDEVDRIVDPDIRTIIKDKLCGSDPKEFFKNPENLPVLENNKARKHHLKDDKKLRRVLIFKHESKYDNDSEPRVRFAKTSENHHVEIFKFDDKEKWNVRVISIYEALKRLKNNEPIIQRNYGDGAQYLFSLSKDDTVYMDHKKLRGKEFGPGYYKVHSLAEDEIEFRKINDSRPKPPSEEKLKKREKKREDFADRVRCEWNAFHLCDPEKKGIKVIIDPIGRVIRLKKHD